MILYLITQLTNVVLGTIKSILTITGKPWIAAITTTISCTLSAMVVKFVSEQAFTTVIIITAATNLLGVPIATWIIDKTKKEKLWVYTATIKCTEEVIIKLKTLFNTQNIKSVYEAIATNEMYELRVFSTDKNDSRIIRQAFKAYNAKYYIIEPKG